MRVVTSFHISVQQAAGLHNEHRAVVKCNKEILLKARLIKNTTHLACCQLRQQHERPPLPLHWLPAASSVCSTDVNQTPVIINATKILEQTQIINDD